MTSEVLADAGVAIDWLKCIGPGRPDLCHARLRPGEMVLRLNQHPHRVPHILGAAIVQPDGPDVMATVYTPSLILRSIKTGVKFSTIVGRVAAHEIGHLLIGTNSHSPVGLNAGRLGRAADEPDRLPPHRARRDRDPEPPLD